MSFNPRLEILPWLLEAGKKWLNTIGIYSSGLERTICSTEQSASSATSYKLPRRRSIAHLRAELQAGSLQSTLSKPTSDQVKVRIEANELVITGHRPLPKCCDDGDLKIWEIPLGHFERRLRVIAGGTPLILGEVTLKEGLLIIQLRKHS
jgi:hypothetical protein